MTNEEITQFFRENLTLILQAINWFLNKFKKPKPAKFKKEKEEVKINKKRKIIFRDNLIQALTKWTTIEGDPQISNIRGRFPFNSSLLLEEIPGLSRNTFVGANNVNIKDGEIECDIYLERDSLVNIVVRADDGWNKYYMIRLDSRTGCFNGILFDSGNRAWDFVKKTSVNVKSDHWYHVKVRFQFSLIKLFIDKRLVATAIDKTILESGNIGIFNEIKRVFVNDFIIRRI